jgi:integrase
MKRAPGEGTIETLPSGRFRVRVWLPDGRRHSLGTYDTVEEAEGVLAAVREELAAPEPVTPCVLSVGGMLEKWEKSIDSARSYVAMPNVRSIRRRWIDGSALAAIPARDVRRGDVVAWTRTLGAVGPSYARQALTHLRSAFAWAVDAELVDQNPARDVRIPRRAARTDEPWTYLQPAEQTALLGCEKVDELLRVQIGFAIGTGLRMGEQLSLRLVDLHVTGDAPHLVVRYGSRRRAPKGRRIRTVPLFGLGLRMARRQLELLADYCPPSKNEFGLVFPGPRGGFQKVSRVAGWKEALAAAGITRRVRWHDLRHTCAASLISGWWGEPWRLEPIKELLGHHSIRMTERYAHIGASALKEAAARTTGPRLVHEAPQLPAAAGDGLVPRHSPRRT